jgi:hypothetical protein
MVSADKVDALLQKNTAVLERIRRIIERVASSRRAAARWSPDPALGCADAGDEGNSRGAVLTNDSPITRSE